MNNKKHIINVGSLTLLKPTVNFANKITAHSMQIWGPRIIADCQLIYVTGGKGKLTIGGNVILLNAGECVFYGANSPHKLEASKVDPFTFMSIHFEWHSESPKATHPFHGIRNLPLSDLDAIIPCYKIKIDDYGELHLPHHFIMPNVESLFAKIVREYRIGELGSELILRGLVMQLLTYIVRHQINGNYLSEDRRKIAPALEAVRKQPHLNWTLDELATLCGYHPTYFSTIFKETIGFTPKHYLILERIKRAKQLLLEEKTIEEVSLKLGYTSIHYFCRNFKTITGLTPTEYKLQSLEL